MTDLLCVTCSVLRTLRPGQQPRRPNIPHVCDGCRTRLTDDLSAIPAAYVAVDLETGRTGSERRASGFESRPPLNTPALSLLAQGSVLPAKEGRPWPQDQLGTIPPLELLWWWCEDWHGVLSQRGMPGPTMASVCSWLLVRLDLACSDHPAVDEFARDVKDISGQLRVFGTKDRGEPAGRCPRMNGDARCDTPLYVDPYVDEIECSRCHTKWKRREGQWMHLRAQQEAAKVEIA